MIYNNFKALGAEQFIDPPQPNVAIPFFRDIADVLDEAHILETKHNKQISAIGLEATYENKLKLPFMCFRGEFDRKFAIMPTRYRFSGEPDPLQTTRERIKFEDECAGKISAYLNQQNSKLVTDESARAAARHFGAPSSYVDFTFNPDVAAFFGHPEFKDRGADGVSGIGIMYGLDISGVIDELFGMSGWSPTPGGGTAITAIPVSFVWKIPYLSWNPKGGILENAVLTVRLPDFWPITIRTHIVPEISRISAQHGLFLEADFEQPENWWANVFLWGVLDFYARKWCFLRQDFAYEKPESRIDKKNLFHSNEKLDMVTAGFKNWK